MKRAINLTNYYIKLNVITCQGLQNFFKGEEVFLTLLLPRVPKIKIQDKSQISFLKKT